MSFPMEFLFKAVALLSSGLFAGAALYLTAVEHPARISQGASFALQEFRPSYKRAAPLQASLAIICFLCSGAVWWLTGRWPWLAGGALVGAVVPFTFACIMSTNRLLLDAASPPKDDETSALLAKWARLHAVRTCLSLLGFVVLLVQAVRQS
jgi:Anthrone oxygenase